MNLTEEKNGSVLVLGLTGRIDLPGANLLQEKLAEVIGRGEQQVVLDFAGVTFINSTGLSTLIVAGKRLAKSGGKLVLAEVSEPIQRTLKISGLSAFFVLQATRADALASLSQ